MTNIPGMTLTHMLKCRSAPIPKRTAVQVFHDSSRFGKEHQTAGKNSEKCASCVDFPDSRRRAVLPLPMTWRFSRARLGVVPRGCTEYRKVPRNWCREMRKQSRAGQAKDDDEAAKPVFAGPGSPLDALCPQAALVVLWDVSCVLLFFFFSRWVFGRSIDTGFRLAESEFLMVFF